MNPVLTSAWEISGVMEEPILPFITLPPPVMVPEFQGKKEQVYVLEYLGRRRQVQLGKRKPNAASYQPSQ